MKKAKLLLLIPITSFLAGCVTTDYSPFEEDDYIPIGYQTESITRELTSDEEGVLIDGLLRMDDYVTGVKIAIEERYYLHSYFGKNTPIDYEDVDASLSYSSEAKTYNNDVKVVHENEKESFLNDYVSVDTQEEVYAWTFLPTPATYEMRRSVVRDSEDAIVTTIDTGAYVAATDYQTRFGHNAAMTADSLLADSDLIGMNDDETIVGIRRVSTSSIIELERNSYVYTLTNTVMEIKLSLYEPEDDSDPFYLPSQVREYGEMKVMSEVFVINELVKYLDTPITICYQEGIVEYSTTDNGDYDTGSIPEVNAI
jgi:hypothetical protein